MTVATSVLDTESVIKAFGVSHVITLTGLSKNQLRYWDSTGFFEPAYAFVDRKSPYSRVYSFKDVVGLRVLSVLRHEYHVTLKHLRDTAKELAQYTAAPWSDLVLYVWNRQVYFDEPETGKTRGVVNRQYVSFPLISVIDDVREQSMKLRERQLEQLGQVERHKFIAHNAWVVAGTRIPIMAIRRLKDAGYSSSEIISEYPTLTDKDVDAALKLSRDLTKAA